MMKKFDTNIPFSLCSTESEWAKNNTKLYIVKCGNVITPENIKSGLITVDVKCDECGYEWRGTYYQDDISIQCDICDNTVIL